MNNYGRIVKATPDSFQAYNLIVLGQGVEFIKFQLSYNLFLQSIVNIGFVIKNDRQAKQLIVLVNSIVQTLSYGYKHGFYHILHESHNFAHRELRRSHGYALSQGVEHPRIYIATLISIKLMLNEKLTDHDLDMLEENRVYYLDGEVVSMK